MKTYKFGHQLGIKDAGLRQQLSKAVDAILRDAIMTEWLIEAKLNEIED